MIKPCFNCGRIPVLHLNADGCIGKVQVRCRHLDCSMTFVAEHITNANALQVWNNEMIKNTRAVEVKRKSVKKKVS